MSYKIITLDRPQSLFVQSVQLDKSRNTAILIRQSRRGSDKAHIESRMLQESLIPFVQLAREEDDLTHIHIFDEGSGISGTKGIDKRGKLRSMMEEMVADLIGDIVLARPDRLFRDKHFSNVAAFTELAERMRVKVIVPTDRGIIKYDFTIYDDLQKFQKAMQEAYAYIDTQIRYMNRARAFKVAKGFYGGGNIPLPYVLLRDMPKEEQVQVIYEPWQEAAEDLFKKFTEFNFETGRIGRYVEAKPYIFPFMPATDVEAYMPVTTMTKVNGGYTFTRIETLLYYLSNLTLAGFAHGGKDHDSGDTILIPNAFDAAIPLEFLEPCFAAITGAYIDGTPFIKSGGTRQFRRTGIETDAILHGLLTSEDGTISAAANIDDDYPMYNCRKGGYYGQKARVGLGRIENEWALPVRPIDTIVLDRLISLCEYDDMLVDRVKAYFQATSSEGQSALTVLDTTIRNTKKALKRVNLTIVELLKPLEEEDTNTEGDEETLTAGLDPNLPIMKEHRSLQATLRNLQKQRDETALVANEDPSHSISDFYHVLSHLRSEFNKKDPQTKKDIMKKLIEEVSITSISPHLFTLQITWIRPLAKARDDVALLWRSMPTKSELTNRWTTEEEAALRTLYPEAPHREVMQAIPHKTPGQIKGRAHELSVRRDYYHIPRDERFYWTVSYADLQAVEPFTKDTEQRAFLWSQINGIAAKTKRREVTPLWFFPLDMISFAHSFCVSDVVDTDLSGQARTGRQR